MKVLIIVDMQNDFITGALGTPEAVSAKENIVNKICNMNEAEVENTFIFFTRDTHYENYMNTLEEKMLPVPHCQFGTDGWEIDSDIAIAADDFAQIVFDKITFGSTGLLKEAKVIDFNEYSTFSSSVAKMCYFNKDYFSLMEIVMPEVYMYLMEEYNDKSRKTN